jgi:N,N'-diacetyllegionaminate synthase
MPDKVIIIAEAGVNHNGDLELAKKLIDAAAEAGADYVKFQTFKAEKLVSQVASKAEYQVVNTQDEEGSQYTMLKKLELSDDWHYELRAYAENKNIKFLSSGFDEESIDFLSSLGMDLYKIPSGEITNRHYLERIASKQHNTILSTGMADMSEIGDAIEVLTSSGLTAGQITILHCNTQYPTPMTDVNLLAMNVIRDEFGIKVGYSDHTLGIEISIAAVALGAVVIEKHFTLDRTMPGPDHKASLEPDELKAMVSAIRNVELALSGNGIKTPSPSEACNKLIARKSIHLAASLSAGQIISIEDLEMKRPGDGISPMLINEVLGKKVKNNLLREHKLSFNDLYIE